MKTSFTRPHHLKITIATMCLAVFALSPAALLAQYGVNRHHNLRLLRRLKPDDLKKSAWHPERNVNVELEDMVQRFASHDANHLQQIERLKREASKI